jgi:23S rRNA pseudouridine2604 synthase
MEKYSAECNKAGGNMEIRINKFLSSAGVCSRREADRLIDEGRVAIDGKTALMGSRVAPGQKVYVDGKEVEQSEGEVILAFYKPVGVVCSTVSQKDETNIVDYIGYSQRIYPVGRLDKDSEGLILMTNNGEITDKILRSVNEHEKEYFVTVDRDIDETFVKNMQQGIYLEDLDRTTKPCKVFPEGKRKFRIILTQGLNRQIRRMCKSQGRKVVSLKRIRIMNILLGDLKPGEYRSLTQQECKQLKEQL